MCVTKTISGCLVKFIVQLCVICIVLCVNKAIYHGVVCVTETISGCLVKFIVLSNSSMAIDWHINHGVWSIISFWHKLRELQWSISYYNISTFPKGRDEPRTSLLYLMNLFFPKIIYGCNKYSNRSFVPQYYLVSTTTHVHVHKGMPMCMRFWLTKSHNGYTCYTYATKHSNKYAQVWFTLCCGFVLVV